MNETTVTIQGRLVADPVLRHTQRNGTPFLAFRVATNARRAGPEGRWLDGPTSFYAVTAWRALALNAAESLHKGEPVTVSGQLVIRSYQRPDGTTGQDAEIDARAIGHDLSWGQSTFAKVSRLGSADVDRGADPDVRAALDEARGPDRFPGDPQTDAYDVAGGPDGPGDGAGLSGYGSPDVFGAVPGGGEDASVDPAA